MTEGRKPYTRYEWDVLLDGREHILHEGEDYFGSMQNLRSAACSAAKKRGLSVEIHKFNAEGTAALLRSFRRHENK